MSRIPDGAYIVKSAAYNDRVADLANARLDNPLIGFHQTGARNQRWTFRVQNDANEYEIATIATSSAALTAFAHTDAKEGAVVVGRLTIRGLFKLADLGQGRFRISPKENSELAWTLPSESERTQIIIHNVDSNVNQTWFLIPL